MQFCLSTKTVHEGAEAVVLKDLFRGAEFSVAEGWRPNLIILSTISANPCLPVSICHNVNSTANTNALSEAGWTGKAFQHNSVLAAPFPWWLNEITRALSQRINGFPVKNAFGWFSPITVWLIFIHSQPTVSHISQTTMANIYGYSCLFCTGVIVSWSFNGTLTKVSL